MTFTLHPYQHPQDFSLLTTFLSHARSAIAESHYLHPGDLSWQVFHMLTDYQPSDLMQIWEDSAGAVIGFVLRYPPYGAFELQLHPQYRHHLLTPHVLHDIEHSFQTVDRYSTLVNENDTAYIALLTEHGYRAGGSWDYMERPLHDLPPSAPLPSGFVVRSVADDHEAPLRAAVLAAAFDAPAQPERYQHFMHAPGYVRDLDIVAVAPDGEFAAFAMSWVDRDSRVGQFEPVGTAPAYRRQRLGQVVLIEGLRRMHQRGADRAMVVVEAAEEAAVHLYASVGFRKQWSLTWYTKHTTT